MTDSAAARTDVKATEGPTGQVQKKLFRRLNLAERCGLARSSKCNESMGEGNKSLHSSCLNNTALQTAR